MGIDASIAMGVRAPQFESPVNALANVLQIQNAQQNNKLGMMKMDEYQRGIEENNALNAIYSGALGADGKLDQTKVFQGAAARNLGSKIPGLRKGFLEADEAEGKVKKQQLELVDLKLKQSRSFLDGVKTAEDYILWHEGNHSDPVLGPVLAARGITADQARAGIMQALQTPGGFERLLQQSALGIEKFTELNKPTMTSQNLGSVTQMVQTPGMGGAPVVMGSFANTQSPDSVASTETARRGQNMVDARSRESTAATISKPFEVTGPDGTPVLVRQDRQGNITRVEGFGPKAGAEKPLNDSQSKALLFGSRMREADKVINQMASVGSASSFPGSRAPLVGGIVNAMTPEKNQMLNQAKTDFITAVLRRESGAAIASSEFDTADKQYFPQIGDSADVIKQKAANRQLALNGILQEVPEKQRDSLQPKATAAAAPAKNRQGWTLHTDASGNKAYVSPDGKQFEEAK